MEKKKPTLPEMRDYCIEWLLANRQTINLIGISAEISETGKPIQNFQQMVLGKRRFKERYIIPLYSYLINFLGLKPIEGLEEEQEPAPVDNKTNELQEIWGSRFIVDLRGEGITITGHGLDYFLRGRDYEISLETKPIPFNIELIQASEKVAKAARDLHNKIKK